MNWIPFVQTGNVVVDGLMSHVSDVAKMWRHTEDWCQGDEPHSGLNILSQAAQDAANQIADENRQSLIDYEKRVAELVELVEYWAKVISYESTASSNQMTEQLARIMGKEKHDEQ